MGEWEFLSPQKQTVWLLHPVWGVWLQAGWEPSELGTAELWRRRSWEPVDALKWWRNGFCDPRQAARYQTFGWEDPAVCRVVFHLGSHHGLGASSEARLLDGKATWETVDAIHRGLHAGSGEHGEQVLYGHEIRFDAAAVARLFTLSVSPDGTLDVRSTI